MDTKLLSPAASEEAVDAAEARSNALSTRLTAAGLRPTRQRMALGELLFGRGEGFIDRHVTAERLFEEATAAKMPVSLATVYNTLHQFTAAGLLREIAVDGARVYFDTNTSEHHHFLLEDDGELYDIPGSNIAVENLPAPPTGLRVARVDVVVRLRREQGV
ncbi:MAG: iron response transcriptional regulator IrrA [Methylocystis sp.]